MYRDLRVKPQMEACWGCLRGKERPIHQSLGNGLVLPLWSFQGICAPSGILARKVTASSGCHKCRIVHSLWLENWAGDQTGPQTQVFSFHFKGSQLQGLKNRIMATRRVIVRGAKVNAINRPCCLQNNFPSLWNNYWVIARVIQKGEKLEWLCLVRWCAKII